MENFNVRSHQLRAIKRKFILNIMLFSFILFLMEFGFILLYPLFKDSFMSFIYITNSLLRFIFYIVYYLLMTSINIALIIYLYYSNNKDYREEYLNVIFNECKLNEVYLLKNIINFSYDEKVYIGTLFNINNLSFIESFSDASDKYSIDINTVKYYLNDKKSFGTLLKVTLDHSKTGFIKISKQFYAPFDEYKNIHLLQYGFAYDSKLQKYNMISTYGNLGYILEEDKYAEMITSLEKFFKRNIDIVMDNQYIYIFIPDFKFYYTNSLLKIISNSVFDDKIKALQTFHDLWLNLVSNLDILFPNQD